MLHKLIVKNFAIIEETTLVLENNLSVISGETGAGKSILLGALELILGKRANHSVILDKEKKCVIEAVFSTENNTSINDLLLKQEIEIYNELIIRREISPSGRSRAFLNDTPVKLEKLEQIGALLVDMHRQFDNYELLQPSQQLLILDSFLQLNEERAHYQENFKTYKKLQAQLDKKTAQADQAKSERDYLEYAWNEINTLQLAHTEIEDWNAEVNLLENAQSIKETLAASAQSLFLNEQSVLSALQSIGKEIAPYSQMSKDLESINERLQSTIEELKDISAEIEIQEGQIDTDSETLHNVKEKLDLANNLLHKHNANNTEELVAIGKQFESKLNQINNVDADLNQITKQLALALEKATRQSEKISKKRVTGLKKFNKELNAMLPQLGFINAVFDIQHSFVDMNTNGVDSLQFLFDANNIGKLQELRKSISGGEMSRVMLAIKSLLAHSGNMPCLIFDEIDTGISGETAVKVGKVLKTLGAKHQVISITHLPQIASQAKHHLYVYKEVVNKKQSTKVKALQGDERIAIIATMLSGKENSESATLAAKELLGHN